MLLKVKKQDNDGLLRFESRGEIREILINEDIMNPRLETIAVCFVGKNSSGIIELSPKEIEHLYAQVKNRMHLIKGFQVIKAAKGSLI
jgi:hypothetical protein